jgi:hypothetical protein
MTKTLLAPISSRRGLYRFTEQLAGGLPGSVEKANERAAPCWYAEQEICPPRYGLARNGRSPADRQ